MTALRVCASGLGLGRGFFVPLRISRTMELDWFEAGANGKCAHLGFA